MIGRIRRWAHRHAEEGRYTPVGIVFHWTMAALVVFQLGWGWYMGRLPAGGDKLAAFQVHADIGLFMLVLATLRFGWRTIVPDPINDADDLGWQTRAAHITHILFYICFFGLPLSGWAMWSAIGEGPALALLGWLSWPHMPFQDLDVSLQRMILDWAEDIHLLLVIVLLILVPLHVGAALKHHYVDRHDVLEGMLPELPEDRQRRKAKRRGRKRRAPRPASEAG